MRIPKQTDPLWKRLGFMFLVVLLYIPSLIVNMWDVNKEQWNGCSGMYRQLFGEKS